MGNKSCFQQFYLINIYSVIFIKSNHIMAVSNWKACFNIQKNFKTRLTSKISNSPPSRPEQGGLWPASVGIQRLCKTSIDQPVLNGVETLLLSCTAEVNTTFYWGNNQNQGKKYTLPTDFYFPQTNIFS